jgi:MinD superfamily P-loop ATPase
MMIPNAAVIIVFTAAGVSCQVSMAVDHRDIRAAQAGG